MEPPRKRDSYNEYMRQYMKRYRDQRRADAIELLGGRCVDCGSTEDLEFDHIDRSEKRFTIGDILAEGEGQARRRTRKVRVALPVVSH